MPNVTAIEPQVLLDLLALTLKDFEFGGAPPAETEIAVISPWLSDVELSLSPSGRHGCLGSPSDANTLRLGECLRRFCELGCPVRIAVLAYGAEFAGLVKDPRKYSHERAVLNSLLGAGAEVHLCPGLHAKGIVTPLGAITGTTNYTHSGLHLQRQNALYFAFNHAEYGATRQSLLANFRPQTRATNIP
jgi:hypothetical protein